MTTAKHFALTLAVTLCALLATTQAQTPRMATVNISAQSDKVHITAEGDVSELRIDVADEQGDVVFQSGAISGQRLDWKMADAQGERVAPGTYLITVTFRNAAGKLRKRVEEVTVAEDEKASSRDTATPSAVQATITGAGTTARIAKFTGASTIGNAVMTESAGKINVGLAGAPISTLTVKTATDNYGLIHTNGVVQVGTLAGSGSVGTQSGWFGTKSNHPLQFFTNSQLAAMTIATNSKVGIGNTIPAFKLHVVDSSNAGLRVQTNAQGGDLASFGGNGNFRIDAVNIPGGRLSVRESGNVGIGTDSPVARLDVRGDIRLGPSGQYQATGGEENLRIVRGTVSDNATILAGTGFSVEKGGVGRYAIVFNTPFAGTPSVTITSTYGISRTAHIGTTDGVTASSFNAVTQRVFDIDGTDNTVVLAIDRTFHFIAIGPR